MTKIIGTRCRRRTSDSGAPRLNELEGTLDGLRVVRPMTFTVLSIALGALGVVLAAGAFVINNLSQQVQGTNAEIRNVNAKVEAIPQRLTEEFRAMRADMAAQTSAIANAVTAARGTPTQVLLVPAPQSPEKPERAPER